MDFKQPHLILHSFNLLTLLPLEKIMFLSSVCSLLNAWYGDWVLLNCARRQRTRCWIYLGLCHFLFFGGDLSRLSWQKEQKSLEQSCLCGFSIMYLQLTIILGSKRKWDNSHTGEGPIPQGSLGRQCGAESGVCWAGPHLWGGPGLCLQLQKRRPGQLGNC